MWDDDYYGNDDDDDDHHKHHQIDNVMLTRGEGGIFYWILMLSNRIFSRQNLSTPTTSPPFRSKIGKK